jgi:DNA invertase Pin-like site-specific DNA recombinase
MKNTFSQVAMKAIGYVRVSTEMQASEGVSLDAQRQRIEAWALASGVTLVGVEQDAGLSGCRADNRPGLQRAILAACANKCPLVVYSLSRLARSTRDAIKISDTLTKAGSDLVSLSERIDTTTAAGKLAFTMMNAVAQHERDQVSERTKAALQYLRRQGKRAGNIPYGFTVAADGSTLNANASEQKTLARIKTMSGKGMSLRAIAGRLNEQGIKSKTGKAWAAGTVHYLLKTR